LPVWETVAHRRAETEPNIVYFVTRYDIKDILYVLLCDMVDDIK
jgi:hypothetical protein